MPNDVKAIVSVVTLLAALAFAYWEATIGRAVPAWFVIGFAIFAVVAAVCLSYALATVAFLFTNGRAHPLVAGAVAALAVFTALQLSTPDAWKPRIALIERMEARANAVNDSLKTPLSFVTSTELDRIWYAIVKSELDGTSYAPQLAVDSVGDPNR